MPSLRAFWFVAGVLVRRNGPRSAHDALRRRGQADMPSVERFVPHHLLAASRAPWLLGEGEGSSGFEAG